MDLVRLLRYSRHIPGKEYIHICVRGAHQQKQAGIHQGSNAIRHLLLHYLTQHDNTASGRRRAGKSS
ncbi:hypothetical protein PC116_g24995 [Phytophthora cactorum]|uniref:Uncharacterized protein n=1 Tax=Phytophthora cactorum TaxID=29920 RepID=A0A8T1APS6_9STRA|nr:hypothetical protein PC113_g20790 [Phytophthora cactorum]KAG2878502.1 hypothetical protein PC114_g23084 [Phytophthora cactorum]KAG2883941.1 hypothetical protein PC115_g21470 [Phytophthora cactorum]KAG2897089.1 hypothetical protein PC117_g22842 [Phytophthora cactorum]KAG2962534.1 hypothetical protein PC118_g21381 [Phytophthora cactorum]